ncbi:MAG: hypothetical protein ACYSWU_21905 [Planctomycetota bacterium]|jgi:hypothetical protein
MKGYHRAAAAVLLTIVIGVAVVQVRVPGGDTPPRRDDSRCVPAPAAKRQVVVKSNDPCYVCHMPFLEEGLAAVHAKVHVWCGTCHGPSVRHTEDENIGATPPDVVFKKEKVDRMCGQCHDPEEHTILTGKARRARLAEAQKAQRKIKRRKIRVTGVCTDCHGRHWIPPREREETPQESQTSRCKKESRGKSIISAPKP